MPTITALRLTDLVASAGIANALHPPDLMATANLPILKTGLDVAAHSYAILMRSLRHLS